MICIFANMYKYKLFLRLDFLIFLIKKNVKLINIRKLKSRHSKYLYRISLISVFFL